MVPVLLVVVTVTAQTGARDAQTSEDVSGWRGAAVCLRFSPAFTPLPTARARARAGPPRGVSRDPGGSCSR